RDRGDTRPRGGRRRPGRRMGVPGGGAVPGRTAGSRVPLRRRADRGDAAPGLRPQVERAVRESNMTAANTALVIGGGIAGPATAMAHRKAGIEATVYEAYPSAADGVGVTLTFAPNGLAALRTLGAVGAVLGHGQTPYRSRRYDYCR